MGSELEAKQYEGKIGDGNILISIHTEDHDERKRAKELMQRGGAFDISDTGESRIPSGQKNQTFAN